MASKKNTDLENSSSSFTDLDDALYSSTAMIGREDESYKQHKFSFNSLNDFTDEEDNVCSRKVSSFGQHAFKHKTVMDANVGGVRQHQKTGCVSKSTYVKKKKVPKKRPALVEPSDDDSCTNEDDICRCPHVHVKCYIENKLDTGIVDLNDIKHGLMKRINTSKPKFKGLAYEPEMNQSSTTPSNDSNKSSVISDQTPHNPLPISVFQSDDVSQCFEDFHVKNINKLCSDMDQLNMKTSQQSAQNFSSPHPDVIIAKQIKFFKRIYEILHSFTSLNNFLIFKYNNNLSLDNTTDKFPFERFDNFNEFIKKSASLMNWCQKFESSDVNKTIDSLDPTNQTETLNKLKIDNSDSERLESELKSIKNQLTSTPLLTSSHINDYNSCTDDAKDTAAIKSNIDCQSLPQDTRQFSTEAVKASNLLGYEAMNERYLNNERLIKGFVRELDDFVSLHKNLKKINSKEYKIMKRGKYNSLKFQLKAYKNDYKLEHKEKCHFKELTLSYQNKISKSKGQSQVDEANIFNNNQDIMVDF